MEGLSRLMLLAASMLTACGPELVPAGGAVGSDGSSSYHPAEDGEEAAGCSRSIAVGEFTFLDDRDFGYMNLVDVDQDGATDIVGGSGIVALAADDFRDGFSIRDVHGRRRAGRTGDFDGDGRVDFAERFLDDFAVYRDILAPNPQSVRTTTGRSQTFNVGDFDLDGMDDIIINSTSHAEVWRAVGDGSLELVEMVEASLPQPMTWVRLAPGATSSLIFAERSDLLQYDRTAAGVYVLAGTTRSYFAYSLESFDLRGAGVEVVLATIATQTDPLHYGVAYLRPNPGDWTETVYIHPDGRAPPYSSLFSWESPKPVDLDGDGTREIVLVSQERRNGERYRIDVLCERAGELFLCAAVDVPHEVHSVAAVAASRSEPAKLVYTTPGEGTWVAEVRCPT